MEGYGKKELKRVENRQNRKNQGNSIDRITRSNRPDLLEAQRHGTSPWRHDTNNQEGTSNFPFSARQTLETLSERILLLLAL